MPSAAPRRRSPYKFLDSYTYDDRKLFHGRERETETLVSDVISSRIVVLFAKTGTGKTSLINAGARPRLEDVDYETFYIRVEKDPIASVRRTLRKKRLLPKKLEKQPLPDQLRHATKTLGRPIVLFYDQFEEFFIGDGLGTERVGAFILDVAELYRDRAAAVHTVFSMREEYFVEMDVFRDEIPSIFHNESSVRLRPLAPAQAARAIEEPARTLGVPIDDGLAEEIADELEEGGAVEPVRLQIVCDTLWRESGGTEIRLADYDRLGRASRIVAQRLSEDVRRLDDPELRLFARLLPELRTEDGTKYLRGVDELAQLLEAKPETLQTLLDKLKEAHLLKESTINRARYVEWASDYIAERTDSLRTRAQAILYRRVLRAAIDKAASSLRRAGDVGLAQAGWEAVEESSRAVLAREDFDGLSAPKSDLVELERDEAAFALGTALGYGAHERRWFDEARARGVDVWAVVEHALREASETRAAETAVQLLAGLGHDKRALELLESSLDEPSLAQSGFRALGWMRSDAAVAVLERSLEDEAKTAPAIDILRRMRTAAAIRALTRAVQRGDAAGVRAGIALDTIATDPAAGARAKQAAHVLEAEAELLLVAALKHGLETRFWFDWASEHGVDTWTVLRRSVSEREVPEEQAVGAVHLMGTSALRDKRADELLEIAARQPRLRAEASQALTERGVRSRERDEAARQVRRPQRDAGSLSEDTWGVLLSRIQHGECLPILGADITAGTLPSGFELARTWAFEYGYPLGDADDLAQVAQYLAVSRDLMLPKEGLARELRRAARPDFSRPDDVHGVLARLPLPVYLTTRYDDLLSDALHEWERAARVEICRWNRATAGTTDPFGASPSFHPTPATPLVFHLFGHVGVPESIVLTPDDYLACLVAVSQDHALLTHQVRRALATYSLLFIGYRPDDWDFRVLRQIVVAQASLMRTSLVVLLPTDPAATEYLAAYLGTWGSRVYWGAAADFAAELHARWQDFDARGRG